MSQSAHEPVTPAVWIWVADKVIPPLITGLVISVVASSLIARATERYRGHRDHLNRGVDALRGQLLALQRLAGAYWSVTRDPVAGPVQEAEIDFVLADIAALSAACAPDLWQSQESDGPELVALLSATVTGANFGVANRPAEPGRIAACSQAASRLSRRISMDRRHYFSSHLDRESWLRSVSFISG